MSAFVVSHETINAVVHLLDLDQCCCPQGHLGLEVLVDGQPKATGDHLGHQMQVLNHAAVHCRYPHREANTILRPFRWSPRQYTLLEMLKAADCWKYQCSEGEQFEAAEVYQAVSKASDRMRHRIISDLPEYQAVDWDLEYRPTKQAAQA